MCELRKSIFEFFETQTELESLANVPNLPAFPNLPKLANLPNLPNSVQIKSPLNIPKFKFKNFILF